MSHFYGSMQGSRGPTTRQGTASSGFDAHIRGWHVGARIECVRRGDDDKDVVYVYGTHGSSGNGGNDFLLATLTETDGGVHVEINYDGSYFGT